MQPKADLYRDYVGFKGWDEPSIKVRPEHHRHLLSYAPHLAGAHFLEIGFGRGELLDFAKEQGAVTTGSEIIPELIERAIARGHRAVTATTELPSATFDVITAVDVLEHLEHEELSALMAEAARLLRPSGVLIARFPNGQSPFSGAYQNGDLTHVRHLAPEAVRQVAERAGLKLDGVHNPRPLPSGLASIKWRLAYGLRDLIELVIGYVYFGFRFPMDPNVIVVLRRRGESL